MSESSQLRRQPPSPLVFYPDPPPAPSPPQLSAQCSTQSATQPSSTSTSNGNIHVSSSNTVSMPFVRRHVTRRLKAAKAECDKELQRVTNSITAFFEERLRDGEHEQEVEREQREFERERDRESQYGDHEPLREAFVLQPNELHSALQFDEVSSEGGYEAEPEGGFHSRQPSISSTSPSSLRRHSTLPRERPVNNIVSSPGTSSPSTSAVNSPTPPEVISPRKLPPPSSQNNQWGSQGIASRRLSRTIHIPTRPTRSGQSSRSTSRSRSPLPRSSYAESTMTNRRSSRILVDDPVDPIMTVLYEIIAVATDVTDMSLNQLMQNPKICEVWVQRVQNIGRTWDEHPDWHGRNWYVQVLLAIASLSRVVEWWEAEKQFWNFDDNDDEKEEPLTFVMKPPDEDATADISSPRQSGETESSAFRLPPADDAKLRMSRTSSQGRRSRDDATKDLTMSMTPHKQPEHPRANSKFSDNTESARVLATERLRLQAETAQNQNIVVELSLDGDHLLWVNYAWRHAIGSDPEDLVGTRISRLLAPADWHVFRDATRRLQEDDSRTVEVKFRLLLAEPDTDPSQTTNLYQPMEGKGMLMIDREDGRPSHSMWVVKPVGSPEYLQTPPSILLETGEVGAEPLPTSPQVGFGERPSHEPVTPFPVQRPINTALILCRICECNVPQWFFEKHNETCSEVHRLEAEIGECNESIGELRNTIRELQSALDRASPSAVPEYRGMPIFTPASSPGSSSPLQLLRAPLKMKRMSVKKMQKQVLEQLEDILQLAAEVSVPTLKEEESAEPIERQRLLSPASERKMSQVRRWCKPSIEDSALSQLVEDAERVMRQKIDNVVRMQNTIKYSEKIRQEWEERVEQTLSELDAEEEDEEDEEDGEGEEEEDVEGEEQAGQEMDDHCSNRSEYGYDGQPSADPTPLASASPIPFTNEHERKHERERSRSASSSISFSPSMPLLPAAPAPVHHWQPVSTFQTRSSTPSSVSSPLALAAPIVASNCPDDVPPPMDLNETSSATIKPRPSPQNLEPRLSINTPMSPMLSPMESSTRSRGYRRHSTAHPMISPTASISSTPLSPRLPSVAPSSRTTPTSIKDFEIIKPISKGAFGSVFLAKKKVTGDYFAIKVLKKADMISKNQITNVKAERMILMKQAESPFVAKLYFTFQSKENLYLVMEYLNGGDCAALIKSLGSLPEEWTRNYVAEVVLGLDYLHQRGIVHRDLKPDNLLIDQHGHLKLTDFGLSRIGLLGRQTRDSPFSLDRTRARARNSPGSRPPSIDAAYAVSSSPMFSDLHLGGSYFSQRTQSIPRLGSSPYLPLTDDVSESSGSESLPGLVSLRRKGSSAKPLSESPLQSFATELTNDLRSHPTPNGVTLGDQKVVGTPDYLAPETILGLRGDDAAVDWWALGVITYEFLYGIPPFHDETPEKVFENILSGHIEWHDEWMEVSDEAKDFIRRLMELDPAKRLGANGAEEVKAHPFFNGIDWDKVTTTEAAFIPQVTDPESTDYFDPRGAVLQLFHDSEQPIPLGQNETESPPNGGTEHTSHSMSAPLNTGREAGSSPADDDFGSFSFKNLPVLKQANDDVIRKLKTDQLTPLSHTLSEPTNMHSRRKSVSTRIKKPASVVTTPEPGKPMATSPPSPATSTSSIASSASRGPPTPGSAGSHVRKPSDYGAVERFKLNHLESDGLRRNSMPSRLRTASVSTNGDGSLSESSWGGTTGTISNQPEVSTTPSSIASIDLKRAPDPNDRAVTCLLAEDNPITAKIIETLLIRLGCRCVVVADGSEAISVAMGDIKFDCILMDLHMPILDGEGAARYIKSTTNKNADTPIIAVSAYSGTESPEANALFAAYLAKPVQKADLLTAMRHLGFKTATVQGRGPQAMAKVTTAR